MERKEERRSVRPAHRRECEPASSREAKVPPAEISLLQLAQMRRPQSHAIGARGRRRTPTTRVRQQYRCDRFPLLQSPAMDSKRRPEPSAFLAGYNARNRVRRKQLRFRKLQMLLSVQM